MRPAFIQLEITYDCNNQCDFCYNRWSPHPNAIISVDRLKILLSDILNYGIFSINFNGGEPLIRDDFFPLVEYAVELGFDIHCNTNCTLISNSVAQKIARFFPAVCTSLHAAHASLHDTIVGRDGAFNEAIAGIQNLINEGVYVAVNITLSRSNLEELPRLLKLLTSLQIGTVLLSRVLTNNINMAISDMEMLHAIQVIKNYQDSVCAFGRIALPQPFPPCKCTDPTLRSYIIKNNIACTAGTMTARITPDGKVTPCPVLETPVVGEIGIELFSSIWERFQHIKWHKEIPKSSDCMGCSDVPYCGGGCLSQDIQGVFALGDNEYAL